MSSAATVKAVNGSIDAWLPSLGRPDYVKDPHIVGYLVGQSTVIRQCRLFTTALHYTGKQLPVLSMNESITILQNLEPISAPSSNITNIIKVISLSDPWPHAGRRRQNT
jgi:hypothetical protein